MKFGIQLLLCAMVFVPLASTLKCYSGLQLLEDGDVASRTLDEHTCSGNHQSCHAANAHVMFQNREFVIFMGSCKSYCKQKTEIDGCKDLEMYLNGKHNISQCHVSCCDWSDFCNFKSRPLSLQPQSDGNLRCLSGKRLIRGGEIVTDETRVITCPANHKGTGDEKSCLKASITSESQDIEIFRCFPTSRCAGYTCDFIADTIPEHYRNSVTSCKTRCCKGDVCNGTNRSTGRITLYFALVLTFVFG